MGFKYLDLNEVRGLVIEARVPIRLIYLSPHQKQAPSTTRLGILRPVLATKSVMITFIGVLDGGRHRFGRGIYHTSFSHKAHDYSQARTVASSSGMVGERHCRRALLSAASFK